MRILFTNIRLAMRTGTEIVVKDLALRLLERGHDVVVYSPTVGELATELTSRGISVVDDLLKVERAPDVIHGHHMPTTAEAILAFPQTPAIWVCHDAASWFNQPPRFSQVRRLFAVDETCRARLISSDGIPPEKIGILPNAVDLRRCIERPAPLRSKPVRAISLIKHGPTAIVQAACNHFGLTFEAYGYGVDRPVDDVERLCAEADIVFATARTALEAMAAGAAVILVDGRGLGGLVTSANYEQGRRLNFGVGMLTSETTLSGLIEAIGSYDALDAAAISQRVRLEADLDLAVSHLEGIYRSVVDEAAKIPICDPETFRRETIEFCRSWLMGIEPSGPWLSERTNLLNDRTNLLAQIDSLSAETALAQRSHAVRFATFVRRRLGLLQ